MLQCTRITKLRFPPRTRNFLNPPAPRWRVFRITMMATGWVGLMELGGRCSVARLSPSDSLAERERGLIQLAATEFKLYFFGNQFYFLTLNSLHLGVGDLKSLQIRAVQGAEPDGLRIAVENPPQRLAYEGLEVKQVCECLASAGKCSWSTG